MLFSILYIKTYFPSIFKDHYFHVEHRLIPIGNNYHNQLRGEKSDRNISSNCEIRDVSKYSSWVGYQFEKHKRSSLFMCGPRELLPRRSGPLPCREWFQFWRLVVYIYFLTAAGHGISSQLSSTCLGRQCGSSRAGGKDSPLHYKTHMTGHSPQAKHGKTPCRAGTPWSGQLPAWLNHLFLQVWLTSSAWVLEQSVGARIRVVAPARQPI